MVTTISVNPLRITRSKFEKQSFINKFLLKVDLLRKYKYSQEDKMLSTKLLSQAASKYLSATATMGVGPLRTTLPSISPAEKITLPTGGRLETLSFLPWGPISATARTKRKKTQ